MQSSVNCMRGPCPAPSQCPAREPLPRHGSTELQKLHPSASSRADAGCGLGTGVPLLANTALQTGGGLPQANPAYYLTLALGITFPFNLALGIPLFLYLAKMAHG